MSKTDEHGKRCIAAPRQFARLTLSARIPADTTIMNFRLRREQRIWSTTGRICTKHHSLHLFE